MSKVQWRAEYVEPDTRYIDEPDQTVPVGWYVLGNDPDADDVEERSRAEVFVPFAVDEDGKDVTAPLAARIAYLLNAAQVGVSW